MAETSAADVFRFLQLRPALEVDPATTIALVGSTNLSEMLRNAPSVQSRVDGANAFLQSGGLHHVADAYMGPAIIKALDEFGDDPKSTVKDLLKKVKIPPDTNLQSGRRQLSDTLLATFFATRGHPQDLKALQDIYRVYDLVDRSSARGIDSMLLAKFLALRIVTPFAVEPLPPYANGGPSVIGAGVAPTAAKAPNVADAVRELTSLDHGRFLNPPGDGGEGGHRVPFTLREEVRTRLSTNTTQLLAEQALDPGTTPIHDLVEELMRAARPRPLMPPQQPPTPQPLGGAGLGPGPGPGPGTPNPYVRLSGTARLLVVKQQLKRYEAADIAHVENILAGEKKSRSHRRLERSEETTTRETETIQEKATELETADRFELNRETSKTIKDELDIGVDLSVSGKYGPSIEFSSSFSLDSKQATEETAKTASTFARNVVQKSLEKITQRVREEQVRKLILETEETNLHQLENATGQSIRGMYQFLEKVYEAQIFDYGIRQTIDLMVPEPASFLWWLQEQPSNALKLPAPPEPLTIVSAGQIDEFNYDILAAKYGALDVELPPPQYRMLTAGARHGADDASENDQPHSNTRLDITIPAGYRPRRASVRVSLFTDENPFAAITLQRITQVWRPSGTPVGLSDGHTLWTTPTLTYDLSVDQQPLIDNKLNVTILVWESNTYAIETTVVCIREDDEMDRWRLATYKKIRTAFDDRMKEYETKVRELEAQAESEAAAKAQSFGTSPSENHRTVLIELKKHCLSIITRQWYDSFSATQTTDPPRFDLDRADLEGSFIRFFEHAFEWEQIQWIFYPYFWARQKTWGDRFSRQDVDPEFREFLQAGSARVVIPVRPGFEVAISHYLETGKIWNGIGTPPDINSPLYVSIIDEIRDRTDAGKGEIPVGDPWDIRLPTPLVVIRLGTNLPEWQKVAGQDWEWKPVPETT
jgi:hypothetical protein